MLKLDTVCSGYKKKISIKDITLNFKPGNIYAILGPNGSGKSTLLKTIDRILKPIKGTIYLGEQDIKSLHTKNIAQKIAYLPQKNGQCPSCTVFETILLGRKPHITFEPKQKDIEIVEKIITQLKLASFAFKKIDNLSGGETQKVLIARALAQEPDILLLDEPINHLDPKNQIEILKILKQITFELNITTLIVIHDLNLALQVADYFVLMKNGEVIFKGGSDIITKENIRKVFDIDVEILKIDKGKLVVVKFS